MRCTQCNNELSAESRFCGACGQAVQATAQRSSEIAAPAPGQDSMIGREIAGRFRLLDKLGEGGMGAVFRAEQIALRREVALKLLRPDLSADALLVSRFNSEAKLVAKLRHPNTVIIYDFGQDSDGMLFIAMELLEGLSLRALVARDGPLPPARALAIAQQVSASLADAHGHGIIHRDLKPDNIMLTQRGKKSDVVTVLDFGIAKLRDQAGNMTGMPVTQAGALLGTPQYMAPEQINSEAVDGRTDVYALGAVLYEMVTGRLPFEAPSIMAVLAMHINDTPKPPSARRPELNLPPALDNLIMAALQKKPEQRPPSMERYDEMIAECLASLGGGTAQPFAAQNPSALMFAATAAPSAAAAAMLGSGQPQSGAQSYAGAAGHLMPPTSAGTAPGQVGPSTHTPIHTSPHGTREPRPPKSRLGLWIALGGLALAGGIVALVLTTRGDAPKSDDNATPIGKSDSISTDFNVTPQRDIFSDEDKSGDNGSGPSGFSVPPKRDIFGDDDGDQSDDDDGDDSPTTFRHPSLGYAIDLPPGFTQTPPPSPGVIQFFGTRKNIPMVIGVAPVEINPYAMGDLIDENMLAGLVNMLAASAGGAIVESKMRKVQGERRLTGIVDDATNGLRMQYALLPCGSAGIIAYVGSPKGKFKKTRSFRRNFFEERIDLP